MARAVVGVMALLLLAVASAQSPPTLVGNMTLVGKDEFSCRAVLALPMLHYATFLSTQIDASKDESQLNVIAAVLATRSLFQIAGVPPFLNMAYFEAKASFSGFPPQSGSLGVYGSALSQVLVSLIEYQDADGVAGFDPATDSVVSTLSLADADFMTFQLTTSGDLYVFTTRTADNVVQLRFLGSSVVGVTSDDVLVTPKSLKMDIVVSGFPYKGTGTRLAIHAMLASASAQGEVGFQVSDDTLSNGAGANSTYFSWITEANVGADSESASSTVKVRASAPIAAAVGDLPNEVQAFFAANGQAHVTVSRIYFSIDAIQPAYVFWDPSAGVGSVPQKSWVPAVVLGVIITVVVVGIVIGIVVYTKRRKSSYAQL